MSDFAIAMNCIIVTLAVLSGAPNLKVLGRGHMFEVWILISSGKDIIIQIQTR